MDLSITHMILSAGPMVKFVMLVLLVFSVSSWTIVLMKWALLRNIRRDSEDFLDSFWGSPNLNEAYKEVNQFPYSSEAAVFSAGFTELQKITKIQSSKEESNQPLGMQMAAMDNLKRAVRKAETQKFNEFNKALPFLATTGSASPFIGLFGTVWGIMTSFHQIGQQGSASLAVVAPGISEALVVTAAGLFVAIPAVVTFNYFSHKFDQADAAAQHFTTDFLNLIERDLLGRSK
ncbi:protein TolQ [Desulfotalea psychrophila]|uniref:Related to biopolymer transport protein (TolQ) n=1 Tax=Desulfotalea psychrophila (strain LSv54 / DSM 12343) TaxID=177439 RepID=Q6AKI7_DESPS|nr:protein TolQ [Desulfotalea psychrophila]CAG37138.1 related to biopolymer transport protein (TolQ) [Desulfotalea psychrophila LSv54]